MTNIWTHQGNLFDQLSRDLLQSGTGIRFQVKGNSMHPSLQEDDIVTIEPVSASTLNPGDVVFYTDQEANNSLALHRVINIAPNRLHLFIKGDRSGEHADLVPIENILGRVILIERRQQLIAMASFSQKALAAFFCRIAPGNAWIMKTLCLCNSLCRLPFLGHGLDH